MRGVLESLVLDDVIEVLDDLFTDVGGQLFGRRGR